MSETLRNAFWMTLYLLVMVANAGVVLEGFEMLGAWSIPIDIVSLFLTLTFCFRFLEKTT